MNRQEIIKFISDGFERAKGGEALTVFEEVKTILESNLLPEKSHYPLGWIIYYALHQSDSKAIAERERMLDDYLRLDVEKPHKLHSMILTEALRLYKDSLDAVFSLKKSGEQSRTEQMRFSLVAFVGEWGLLNLRPGDWRRKEYEGKMLPSTVEKLITHCVDELSASRMIPPEVFRSVAERALKEYPDSSNLSAQCAQLSELSGDRERAVSLLKSAILSSPSKFFLWSRLADLIDATDSRRLKIALLYKALSSPGPEDYKGKIHLNLADTLAEAGAYPEALWELDRVRAIYEKNDWHLPARFREVEKRIPPATTASDPAGAYRKVEKLADEFIYDELDEILVRKTYHKDASSASVNRFGKREQSMSAWRVTDGEGNNYWFNPCKQGIEESLPIGTHLLVKIHAGRIVKARIPG